MSRIVTEDDHRLITRALAAEGGHLGIGHAGFHLEWGNGWLSGYDCDELKQACIARGLPVIDNRNVPYAELPSLNMRKVLNCWGNSLPDACATGYI